MTTYRWRVDPAPTGQYRSFETRNWPSAYYRDEQIAAQIICVDPYVPAHAKSGQHAPLTLHVANYSTTPWRWQKVTRTFAKLEMAKDALAMIVYDHPELLPESLRPKAEA